MVLQEDLGTECPIIHVRQRCEPIPNKPCNELSYTMNNVLGNAHTVGQTGIVGWGEKGEEEREDGRGENWRWEEMGEEREEEGKM